MARDEADFDVRRMYSKEFLYHYDLDGRDVTLTIARVKAGELHDVKNDKKVKKPILYFEELDAKGIEKGYAVPITVTQVIGQMYGFKVKDWIGKRVTLYPTTTMAFGKTVECIRIRNRIPKAKNGAVPVEPEIPAEPAGDHDDDVSEATA